MGLAERCAQRGVIVRRLLAAFEAAGKISTTVYAISYCRKPAQVAVREFWLAFLLRGRERLG